MEVNSFEIVLATSPPHYEEAAKLFRKYADGLGIDLCFQGFDKELDSLSSMYASPVGGILLAKKDKEYLGCIGIRYQSPGIGEVKRMYVSPETRGGGLGTLLLKRSFDLARECGYKKLRLDTLNTMKSAIYLYETHGFKLIPPYYHNPEPTALFFEADL